MTGPVTAAVYCRVSLAVLGDTTKVEQQEEQCRDACRARGWTVGQVFTDNNRSAWQRNRKRPGWDAMLAGIREGRFGAVASYWGDRIVRQPRDLEDLLDLREGRDLLFASVVGQYDLNNPDHRMMMRWEVARACNESDTISRRQSNRNEQRRRQGLVRTGGRGGRAFGFATDGVTLQLPDRCIVATRAEESEQDIIREMSRRILAGEDNGAVARDVSARGWRTPAGGEFTHGTVKKMLLRPRYAGLMPDGATRAAWPAVLGRDEWERLRLVLAGKAAGYSYATNARKWLLSGIARCGAPAGDGECGAPMRMHPSKGAGRAPYHAGYECSRKGCSTYRSAEHLDAYVITYTVAQLNDSPAVEVPAAGNGEWAALAAERAEAEQLLADPARSRGIATILAGRLARIDEDMERLRAQSSASERDRLGRQYAGITAEGFRGLPLAVQRALVSAYTRVTVLPSTRRGPGFRPSDVRLEPAGLSRTGVTWAAPCLPDA